VPGRGLGARQKSDEENNRELNPALQYFPCSILGPHFKKEGEIRAVEGPNGGKTSRGRLDSLQAELSAGGPWAPMGGRWGGL